MEVSEEPMFGKFRHRKFQLIEIIARERQAWKQSGRIYAVFRQDIDAFRHHIGAVIIPKLVVRQGFKRRHCEAALLEFTRQSWVEAGFPEADFRRKVRGERISRYVGKIVDKIVWLFVACLLGVVYAIVQFPFVLVQNAVLQTLFSPTEWSVAVTLAAIVVVVAVVLWKSFRGLRDKTN
jgi:hypothetical protein